MSNEATILNNIMYILADMLESIMKEVEGIYGKEGKKLAYLTKHYFNTAIFNIKKFRGDTRTCSDEFQEEFGMTADAYLQVLLAIIDRSGKKPAKTYQFYNYVKNFPSQLGIDLGRTEKAAFEDYLTATFDK